MLMDVCQQDEILGDKCTSFQHFTHNDTEWSLSGHRAFLIDGSFQMIWCL